MYRDLPFMGIFGKTKELDIIQFLIAEPYSYYNISSIADILEMHRDTVSRIMKNFQKVNLVEFTEKGRSKFYRLNGSSKIVHAVDLLSAGLIDETGPDLNLFESAIHSLYPSEPKVESDSEFKGVGIPDDSLGRYFHHIDDTGRIFGTQPSTSRRNTAAD